MSTSIFLHEYILLINTSYLCSVVLKKQLAQEVIIMLCISLDTIINFEKTYNFAACNRSHITAPNTYYLLSCVGQLFPRKNSTSSSTIVSIQCSSSFITKITVKQFVFMYLFTQYFYLWCLLNNGSLVAFISLDHVLNILFSLFTFTTSASSNIFLLVNWFLFLLPF